MTLVTALQPKAFEARIFDPSQNSYTQAQDIDSVTSIIEQVRAQLNLGEDEALIIPEHTGVVTEHPIDEQLADLIDQLRQHLYHSPSRRFSRSCSRHPEMSSSQPSPVSSPDTSSRLRRKRRKSTTRTHRTTPRPSSTTPTAGACRNCAGLKKTLQNALTENVRLRRQLEAERLKHSQEVADLTSQIATLSDQVAMPPGMYANLQAENKKLRTENAQLQETNLQTVLGLGQKIKALKAQITELEDTKQTLLASIRDTSRKLESIQQQIGTLESNNSDLKGQLASLTEERDQLRKQLESANARMEELKQENENLRLQLERQDREHNTHLEQLHSNMEIATAAYNEELSGLKARIEELETALTKAREERDEANTRAGALQEEVDALRTQLEELAQILPGQPEALGAAVAKGRTNFRRLFKTAQELLQEKTTLQEQLGQTSQRATDLQEEINELRTQVTELKGSIPILLGRAQEEAKTALQNLAEILEQKEEAFNELLEDHNRLLAQVKQFQTFQSYLVNRLQELGIIKEEEASSLQDKNTTAKDLVAAIESLISHYDTSLELKNSNILDLETRLTFLELEKDKLSEQSLRAQEELEEQITALRGEIAQLTTARNAQDQVLSELSAKNTEQASTIRQLESQIEYLQARTKEAESRLNTIEGSVNSRLKQIGLIEDGTQTTAEDGIAILAETVTTLSESVTTLEADLRTASESRLTPAQETELTTARTELSQVHEALIAIIRENSRKKDPHLQGKSLEELTHSLSTIISEHKNLIDEMAPLLERADAEIDRLNKLLKTEKKLTESKIKLAIIAERKRTDKAEAKYQELTYRISKGDTPNLRARLSAERKLGEANLNIQRLEAELRKIRREKQAPPKRVSLYQPPTKQGRLLHALLIEAKNDAKANYQEAEKLRERISELETTEANYQEAEKLRERISELETTEANYQKEAERLQERILQLETTEASYQEKIRELQERILQLETTEASHKKEAKRLQERISILETTEANYQKEAERLQERILQLETTLRSARAAIVELQQHRHSASAAEPEFVEDLHERYEAIGDQWERYLENQHSLSSEEVTRRRYRLSDISLEIDELERLRQERLRVAKEARKTFTNGTKTSDAFLTRVLEEAQTYQQQIEDLKLEEQTLLSYNE